MRTSSRNGFIVRAAALLLGVAVVSLALLGWRVPRGSGALGADLYIVAGPTGELSVSPVGYVLHKAGLRPGDAASGRLVVRNLIGRRAVVRLRATTDAPGFEPFVRVEIRTGSGLLFRGSLRRLRERATPGLALAAGGQASLAIRAWLPSSARDGYQARVATATLEFRTRTAEN